MKYFAFTSCLWLFGAIAIRTIVCEHIDLMASSRSYETDRMDSGNPQNKSATDLWFPKVFNETDIGVSSGRSSDSRPNPMQLLNFNPQKYQPSPANHRMDGPTFIYASRDGLTGGERHRIKEIHGQKKAQDRFSPSEAYSFTMYKPKDKQQQNPVYLPPSQPKPAPPPPQFPVPAPPPPPPPPRDNTYIPPKDLYAFPPNNVPYDPPTSSDIKPTPLDSYLSPLPSDDDGKPTPSFQGPLSPAFLSSLNGGGDSSNPPSSGDDGSSDGIPDDGGQDDGQDDGQDAGVGVLPAPDQGDPHDHDHHHHHDHDHGHGLPAYLDHAPTPQDYQDYRFSGSHGVDAFPEVIYDHDPHHDYFEHHHHHPYIPPPTTTTEPPPPPPLPPLEPEQQPRVKKYSYFYLSRKLWYIPLYFTVWFTFYVTWLILQSIGRHKVDLPNHLVNKRSVIDMSHKQTVEKVNRLTEFVMGQIDEFKEKYII